jgi:multidrug resistance efflux pump
MDFKESKIHDIQRKSDYVYDILQKTPSWIITWGNSFFLVFLLLLILLAHFIQYPDTIIAETTIRMKNPPITVDSEKAASIEHIYYQNGTSVKKGDIVIKLESRANWNDIQELEKQIISFKETNDFSTYVDFEFEKKYVLGELSIIYSELLKEYDDFKHFISNDNTLKKVNYLEKEISNIVLLNQSLQKQEALFEKKFKLSKKNLTRNKKLNTKGVISDQENEKVEANYLTESRQLESFKTNQINNQVKIIQLRSTTNELLTQKNEELVNWENRLKEKVNRIINEIEVWKEQFLIEAPISGKVSIGKNIVADYHVHEHETVFNIIPIGKQEIIGLAEMPVANSGEIQLGNKVQIRLKAFPYQEYGILTSEVKDIALLPKESEIGTINILELELPSNLTTTYGKEIPFSNGMTATALIIKERKSLLQRIFDQLFSIFSDS